MAAEFPATDFPELNILATTRRPYLGFSSSTAQTCYWTFIVPQGWTGTKTAYITYVTSATSGDLDVDVGIEAITDGDALDLSTTNSFDTVNSTNDTTVPGTAYTEDVIAVTLTNNDSSAAGDYARLSLYRDVANDNAAAAMLVLSVEIRDAV
jgi:hypothetical protein